MLDSYGHDLWGNPVSVSEQVTQRLRYAGYWYDQELGWYWMTTRAYNPRLERLLQWDRSQQEGIFTYGCPERRVSASADRAHSSFILSRRIVATARFPAHARRSGGAE